MQSDQLPEEFPSWEEESPRNQPEDFSETASTAEIADQPAGERRLSFPLQWLSNLGIADSALRIGTHLLSLALVLLVVWAMREFYLNSQTRNTPGSAAQAASLATPLPTVESMPELPSFVSPVSIYAAGVPRLAMMHTTIPSRPRTEVITYTVLPGDTVSGIAEKFGLKVQTVMWGNYYILGDNPHAISVGQELNILPVDGTYHKWSAGEGLNGVAEGYAVKPEDIINWPGNHLSMETVGNFSDPDIEPGTFLVVPNGTREYINWSAPRISRDDPSVARYIGPGACGTILDGAVGFGTFIWPSANHFLSGYDYSPATNHYGIDIDGDLGTPLWASDAGVVVYAGWNDHGYGNMVVVDHGGDWQTLYAHMDTITAGCGQSVFQGTPLGTIGTTGASSGPHIHFEMLNGSYGKVNPWDYLP